MTTKMTAQQALKTIPRQQFVEMNQHNRVQGHSIPPQSRVEQILNSLHANPMDKMLHIGTGAGYLTALLSRMVDKVVTLEQCPTLADAAQKRFDKLKLNNIQLLRCDGNDGATAEEPFDIILISTPRVTERQKLLSQLASDGHLIAVEEDEYLTPILVEYHPNARGSFERKELGPLEQGLDTGAIMLDLGVINETLLQQARQRARKENKPLIDVLRKLVDVEEIDLYRALAVQSEMEYKDLEELIPIADPAFFGSFPAAFSTPCI